MEQNQNVQPVVEIDHVSKRFAKVLANVSRRCWRITMSPSR